LADLIIVSAIPASTAARVAPTAPPKALANPPIKRSKSQDLSAVVRHRRRRGLGQVRRSETRFFPRDKLHPVRQRSGVDFESRSRRRSRLHGAAKAVARA
jgi:hypothetical protein